MARRGEGRGSPSAHIYITTPPLFPQYIWFGNSKSSNSEAAGDLPRYFEEESEKKNGREEGRQEGRKDGRKEIDI